MAHAQKPDFVFLPNGRVHLNRPVGASIQSTTGSRGVRISGSNAGYSMFRGSVKGTGYPLHSAVSPSLPHPCVTVCHHISTGVYHLISSLEIPSPSYKRFVPDCNHSMHRSRQFPLHFPTRVSPCAITFQLESSNVRVHLGGHPGKVSHTL